MGGQNLQKVREPKDWLPEAWTQEESRAINSSPTMEAETPLISETLLQTVS